MITERVKVRIGRQKRGQMFTVQNFSEYGSRATIDKILSRLAENGEIARVSQGIYVRPKKSEWVGEVLPSASEVAQFIARKEKLKLQTHGAKALNRVGLSTQVPTTEVFLTNGSSRTIRVGKQTVRLVHTSNTKCLQYPGEAAGEALNALLYLGKKQTTMYIVVKVLGQLTGKQYTKFKRALMPAWMTQAVSSFEQSRQNVAQY